MTSAWYYEGEKKKKSRNGMVEGFPCRSAASSTMQSSTGKEKVQPVQPLRIVRATRALCALELVAHVSRDANHPRRVSSWNVRRETRTREKGTRNKNLRSTNGCVSLSRLGSTVKPREMRLRVFGKSLRLNEREEKMMSRDADLVANASDITVILQDILWSQ